jgi:hypothetical protein
MNTTTNTSTMEKAETGCVRSVLFPIGEGGFPIRLDLVLLNDVAMRRLGATYGEGQAKYGTFNWQKGFNESVYMAHAMEHLLLYMAGDKSEDHLAHACWNLMTLMWVQEKKPELLDIQNARVTDFATLQKPQPEDHVFVGAVVGGIVSSECVICGETPEGKYHKAAWELPHAYEASGYGADSPCKVCSHGVESPLHHNASQR